MHIIVAWIMFLALNYRMVAEKREKKKMTIYVLKLILGM